MSLSQRGAHPLGPRRHRKTRGREGLVLVEGIRSVGEALKAGAEPVFAVVSPRLEGMAWGAGLLSARGGRGGEVERVGARELDALADTERPQGVLLVCRQPEPASAALDA